MGVRVTARRVDPVAPMTLKMSTFEASGILWPALVHFDPLGLDFSDDRPKGRQRHECDAPRDLGEVDGRGHQSAEAVAPASRVALANHPGGDLEQSRVRARSTTRTRSFKVTCCAWATTPRSRSASPSPASTSASTCRCIRSSSRCRDTTSSLAPSLANWCVEHSSPVPLAQGGQPGALRPAPGGIAIAS